MIDRKECAGCEDNFYNSNNPYNIKECWNRKTAKMVKRLQVPMSLVPPWNMPVDTVPDCYTRKGYAFVNPVGLKPCQRTVVK